MFCKNCGKEIEDGKEICDSCAAATTTQETEIPDQVYTNGVVQEQSPIKESTTASTNNTTSSSSDSKSKMAAGLFGIFLGAFGVHNFYLGYIGKAVAQLLITILTCGIGATVSSIWGLIEGILILTGSIDKDAQGNPLKD